MFVITRNGKTTVYTGWRAWLIGGLAIVAVWLVFALVAFAWIGIALTFGFILLLAIPAIAIVALFSGLTRR